MTDKQPPPVGTDFESSLKRLETLVERLESGNLSLEDSLKEFEEGVTLVRTAQKTLASAEQRVIQLTGNDEPQAVALDADGDDEQLAP